MAAPMTRHHRRILETEALERRVVLSAPRGIRAAVGLGLPTLQSGPAEIVSAFAARDTPFLRWLARHDIDLPDLDHNGRLTSHDLVLARRALNKELRARPLSVGIDPPPAAGAGNRISTPVVSLKGETFPNAVVRLDKGADGSVDAQVRANLLGQFRFTIALGVGSTPIVVSAHAKAGRVRDETARLTVERVDNTQPPARDTRPPIISLQAPGAGHVIHGNLAVDGTVIDDLSGVAALQVRVDGGSFSDVAFDSAGRFHYVTTLPLDGTADGKHTLDVRALDRAGNVAAVQELTFTLQTAVVRDTTPPTVTLHAPGAGGKLNRNLALDGVAQDDSSGVASVQVGVDSNALTDVPFDAAGRFAFSTSFSLDGSADGAHAVLVRAVDRAGNISTTQTITFTLDTSVPPDPSELATAVDPAATTVLADSTRFLYSGPSAIQSGVSAGTIDVHRAAVLRGRVLDRAGTAVSAVTISALGHPEFGRTHTRADGMFDLAVNGGEILTIDFTKDGLLPVQRPVDVPWQDYVAVPDVVMVPVDSSVTAVDLSSTAPIQVARGSPVTDQDGTRQSTLLFAAGTDATMTLPDGTTTSLATLHVRATEYTVGPSGPEAMPAILPPQTAYTYAVELGADEAIGARATTVTFDKPVILYVDNFLGFPTGGPVPDGFYDRNRGAWVAQPDGRIIAILSVTNGLADLDIDGSGHAADPGALATLGVSDAERAQLASLYQPGQSMWRVPITHFSPWDCNWPFGLPSDARAPQLPPPQPPHTDDPCTQPGSTIDVQNQALGEDLPIQGTPFVLHYQSDRLPGRVVARTVDIPLSLDSVPASLKRIDVTVDVAGRHFQQSFAPAPGQRLTFTWDGKDAYGRAVQGVQSAKVVVAYAYPGVYGQASTALTQSFGLESSAPGISISGNRNRSEVVLLQKSYVGIGVLDPTGMGLGGWTLDAQNAYDVLNRVLDLGDGSQRHVEGTAQVIGTFHLDSDGRATTSDGSPLNFARPAGVAVGPDGSIYVADFDRNQVSKIAPDGTVSIFAGTGTAGFSGDGGPATQAALNGPFRLAVGPDGSLYINDFKNSRIRRVAGDGTISSLAGPGIMGRAPGGMALGPDGSLYVADLVGAVRRRRPDGSIQLVAGNGSGSGDGIPATQARLGFSDGVAVAADGTFFVTGDSVIRKVGPDGVITTVAGDMNRSGYAGDGGPASQALLDLPRGLAIAPDGSLYIGDANNYRIRRLSPDGVITTVVGTGIPGYSPDEDGGPADQARLGGFSGDSAGGAFSFAADGSLLVADVRNGLLRRVATAAPGFSASDLTIASEDGTQVYQFDATGRHFRTLDALTGAAILQFGYDSGGRLSSVTDASGNVIAITHDGAGNPSAIVAPGGQRTVLGVDASGYLASVTSPAGATTLLTSTSAGLLTSLVDPMGNTHRFTYDDKGRLTKDEGLMGESTLLGRAEDASGFTVTATSALGEVATYRVEHLPDGSERRTTTDAGGGQSIVTIASDRSEQATYADGTTAVLVRGPDPRWGMQAPLPKSMSLTTPGGLTQTLTISRDIELADPSNPFSLLTQTDHITVNSAAATKRYDAAARTITTTDATGMMSISTLDALARVVAIQHDSALDPIRFTYDDAGRLMRAEQGAESLTFGYDSRNQVVSRTNGAGQATHFAYDNAGQVIAMTTPGGRTYQFAYDADGNRTSVTMPGGSVYQLAYDALGQDAGSTPPGQMSGTTKTYDADRELERITLPGARVINFTSDATGRPTAMSFAEATDQYTYTSGDNSGRISHVIRSPSGGSSSEDISYVYDGDLVTAVAASGVTQGNFAYTYNGDDTLASVTFQSGADIVQTGLSRDADGMLIGYGPFTIARGGPDGAPSAISDPSLNLAFGYDSLGRVVSRTEMIAGQAPYADQIGLDAAGRTTRKVETVAGTTHTYDYEYDADGQLAGVLRDGVTVEAYTYDADGNRVSRQLGGGPVEDATYDSQGRLLGLGNLPYQFDAAGFLVQRAGDKFVTSARGELLSATLASGASVTYAYDGLGRRVARTDAAGTEQYFYGNPGDPLQITAVRDEAGVLTTLYYDEAGLLFALQRSGSWYYVATDAVGTPRVISDASGQVVKVLDFDSFGNPTADSNPTFVLPIGFGGGLADTATGLVHNGWRDYDPRAGRWTSRDPSLFGGRQANLYAYAGNDPVDGRDPSGLFCVGGSVYDGIGGGSTSV
jgi:RHS repeat-associated protein